MVRDRDFPSDLRMTLYFMAARTATVKLKAKNTRSSDYFVEGKSSWTSHYATDTGTRYSWSGCCLFRNIGGSGSPCSRQDSTILRARPCAISTVSATLRPSVTRPGTSGLVRSEERRV